MWWHTLVTWNSGSKGVRSRTSGANLRYLMGHCWKFLSGKVAQWTNKDESGDLQNKKGVLKEERECRRMLEYTNFNQTKPAKDVQAGNSGRSPDVKAGFFDVPALPEGSQGRDFLLEQARYLRKSRALDPGSALTRGKSLLSQHPAPDYSIAEARAPASCRRAAPMLGRGGGRAFLPGMLSVVLRKQPSGFARPPSLIAEVLGRRISPTLPKPAGTYLASSLGQGWTGPGPVISCVWSGDRGVERLYRTETVLSLYGFVPKMKADRLWPRKTGPGAKRSLK